MRYKIFISSVQKEFANERRMLSNYLQKDALLGKYFDVFVFDDLKKDHSSHPKNPLIADAFYYTRYIERMGTGIQDMTRRCLEYGLPEPEFRMRDGFVATIYRKKGLAFEKVNDENFTEKDTEKIAERDTVKDTERDTVKDTEKISLIQEIILQKISNNKHITISELSEKVKINIRNVKNNIAKLKSKGLIERIGTDKSGYWKIKITEQISGQITEQIGGQISGQISGQINDTLTDRQKEILDILENNPRITRSQLSQKLQINKSAIYKHLDNLKTKGLIERIGPDKGGYWKVKTTNT